MRGMLNGEWFDLEPWDAFGLMDWECKYYIVLDDPESGAFTEEDFEEFEP